MGSEVLFGLVPPYPQVLYFSLVSTVAILASGFLTGMLKMRKRPNVKRSFR
jgi:hypothetical protein